MSGLVRPSCPFATTRPHRRRLAPRLGPPTPAVPSFPSDPLLPRAATAASTTRTFHRLIRVLLLRLGVVEAAAVIYPVCPAHLEVSTGGVNTYMCGVWWGVGVREDIRVWCGGGAGSERIQSKSV